MSFKKPPLQLEEEILFPRRRFFLLSEFFDVLKIPELSNQRLYNLKKQKALTFGSFYGVLYGAWRTVLYGTERLDVMVSTHRLSGFMRLPLWVAVGAGMAYTYVEATEQLARYRGKSDQYNSFIGGFLLASPFAFRRARPFKIFAVGTIYGLWFIGLRYLLNHYRVEDYIFRQTGHWDSHPNPVRFPEFMVFWEGLRKCEEEYDQHRLSRVLEWRKERVTADPSLAAQFEAYVQ